jgi:transposase-like protein
MKKLNIDAIKVREDYEGGLPIWKVALKHGVSKTTIAKWLRKMNVPITTENRIKEPHRFLDKKFLLSLHEQGKSPTEIANVLETSTTAISNYLKRHNIIPNYCNLSERMQQLEDIQQPWATYENLYNLYIEKQLSLDEIAREFKSTSETIKLKLQKLKIPVRTHGEASKIASNRPEMREFRSKISKELWQNEEIRNHEMHT